MPPRKRAAPRKKPDPTVQDITVVGTGHRSHRAEGPDEVIAAAAVIDPEAQEQIAGPIPAAVVADHRDTRTRRLAWLGLAVLAIVLLGWVLNDIHDAKHDLHQAKIDRSVLIHDVTALARVMERQGIDLTNLRVAIIQQNKILRKAGYKPIPVPTLTNEGGGAHPGGGHSSTPRSQSPSSAPPSSRPTHSPPPPSHSPRPRPSPRPIVICLPIVGCVPPSALRQMTVLDWQTILVTAVVEAQ